MTSINSQEMLLILTKWEDGSVYVAESEIRPYTAWEVQHIIDSLVSASCAVTHVQRLDMTSGTVEDITNDFDIPECPTTGYRFSPKAYNAVRGASI